MSSTPKHSTNSKWSIPSLNKNRVKTCSGKAYRVTNTNSVSQAKYSNHVSKHKQHHNNNVANAHDSGLCWKKCNGPNTRCLSCSCVTANSLCLGHCGTAKNGRCLNQDRLASLSFSHLSSQTSSTMATSSSLTSSQPVELSTYKMALLK